MAKAARGGRADEKARRREGEKARKREGEKARRREDEKMRRREDEAGARQSQVQEEPFRGREYRIVADG
jgi:hypothetical protein